MNHGAWGIAREMWEFHRNTPSSSPEMRLLKIVEEFGEVANAVVGVKGSNERKGVYATNDDVIGELCDLMITVMVALHDYTPNPATEVSLRLIHVQQRKREMENNRRES